MTKTDNLTMPTEILNTNARNVLQTFANKLWDTMVSHDVKVVDIKNIYDKSVNDLLGDNSIKQITYFLFHCLCIQCKTTARQQCVIKPLAMKAAP